MTDVLMRTSPTGSSPSGAGSVLVTGGSGGIGRAVCRGFAAAGWTVGVHYYRGKASAESVVHHIERGGGRATLYNADIRDAQAVQQMVAAFSRDHAPPVSFVCAAGIGSGQLVLTLRDEEWNAMIATNLTGTFHCLRAMVPSLRVQGGGSILVIGSYAGYQGAAGQAAYAASKAGLIGLAKTAALEWGQDNIRVNVLWPGWQLTTLTEAAITRQQGWRDHALGRPPALDEVVRTIIHLTERIDVSGQLWNCDSRVVDV